MTATRTLQLRRYRIVDGQLDDFVDWFRAKLAPAREAFGFSVEFAIAVPEACQFVWGVSADGDVPAFKDIDHRWQSSAERRAVFDGEPARIADVRTDFVDRIV